MNHNWLLMLLYNTCYIIYLECIMLIYFIRHNLLKMHIKIRYMLLLFKIYIIYMCHKGRCVINKYT